MNERNVAASVRARLLNRARETKQDFNLVLTRYAIERLLYRISISKHADPRRPPKLPHLWPPKLLHLAGVS